MSGRVEQHPFGTGLGSIRQTELTPMQAGIVGWLTSGCDWLGGQGLATVRVWQQNGLSARSLLQQPWLRHPAPMALRCNLRQLYAGSSPMLAAYSTQMCLVFAQQPYYERGLEGVRQLLPIGSPETVAWCGASVATTILCSAPLESLALRLQMASREGQSITFRHVLSGVVQQKNGVWDLWRGAGWQAMRSAGFIATMIQVPKVQSAWSVIQSSHPCTASFSSGIVEEGALISCAILGAVLTHPVDVIRTKLQCDRKITSLVVLCSQLNRQKGLSWSRGLLGRTLGYLWSTHVYTYGAPWLAQGLSSIA